MKYIALFVVLLACMPLWPWAGRRQLFREAWPMLRFAAISAAAVLAVALIAYFGGHIRVL